MPSLDDLSSLAAEASRVGGTTILAAGRDPTAIEKAAGDYVTEVDRASENAIAAFLTQRCSRYPGRRRRARRLRRRPLLAGGSAGRHHQLRARLPDRRRLGRLGGGRPPHGRRRPRPVPSGDLHRCARAGSSGRTPTGAAGRTPARLGPIPGTRRRGHRLPVPAQGGHPPLPPHHERGARPLRGPPTSRCGVPRPRLGGVGRLRRLLRARPVSLGRRRGRTPDRRGGRPRHRLGRRPRLPREETSWRAHRPSTPSS